MIYLDGKNCVIVDLPKAGKQVVWQIRPLCPCCGGKLYKNDVRTRVLFDFDGFDLTREYYLLTRWRCFSCNETHIALPVNLFFFRRRLHVGLCEQLYEKPENSIMGWMEEKTILSIQQAVQRVDFQYTDVFGQQEAYGLKQRPGWLSQMLLAMYPSRFPPVLH